jgi:hypothetical protein
MVFLNFKANASVFNAILGHGPHSLTTGMVADIYIIHKMFHDLRTLLQEVIS